MQCAALIMVKLVSMLIKFIFKVKKKLLQCIFTKSITDHILIRCLNLLHVVDAYFTRQVLKG